MSIAISEARILLNALSFYSFYDNMVPEPIIDPFRWAAVVDFAATSS